MLAHAKHLRKTLAMQRRNFLKATAAGAVAATVARDAAAAEPCCLTYPSPEAAMMSPRETFAFLPAIYTGTGKFKPDYMATVDVDPDSKTYSKVVGRLAASFPGDELHHFGWNACSSCHGVEGKSRRYLVVPGLVSGRIYILDAADPRQLKKHKVIEPTEIARKTKLTTPHTVHCLADGTIMISMLGDTLKQGPGGFLLLDENFNVKGRWEKDLTGMNFNYDFWYQPRLNVMVSSEWAAPATVAQGFKLEDVKAGKYGQHLHFWDWNKRVITQSIDLGGEGLIPLEVRFHHKPDSPHGFVGAALSSAVWHYTYAKADAPAEGKADGPKKWQANKVVQVEPVEVEGWPFPVPGLITDIVLSMDDRFLYFSNWLHGDIRQYDVSNPAAPKLTGRVWLGGVLKKGQKMRGNTLHGGPQMLQLSLDGKRLYVTNSLYSKWDNQFYPEIGKQGSYMMQIDCNTKDGGLEINENFFVDFGKEPGGPARAHEIRFPGGDSTSDIWS